ncbi:MAG: hypothetical protein CVT80_02560 [Alphaproteobacteria bacterium HGW-Alphaproteobacteria-2]|nr:MAG: hypothetical protein CVT80_02560 [Alphaproteobacteria bacterium HGW-Alphaproteobacteria-2]
MKSILLAGALSGIALPALADDFTARILAELEREGFRKVEIDLWPGQVKIEARHEGRRLEALYDRATGEMLWQDEQTRPAAPALTTPPRLDGGGAALRLSGKDDRGRRRGYDRWGDDRYDDDDDDRWDD